jgi:peptide-methionine (S)-S-oxide reductase
MKKLSIVFLFFFAMVALNACAQKPKQSFKHIAPNSKELAKYSVATFAAGCFWHTEGLFESIKGVQEVVSGYAGGNTKNPTYESIETGSTGHAETVNVYYDSSVVSYATLLKIYIAGQDPTQVNGQGNDLGTQYRSVVFYRNSAEKQQAENYIKTVQPQYKKAIAVQVVPFTTFWMAEDYHQNFIELNPNQGYVRSVCVPEIKELQKKYPQYIKPERVL